MTRIAVCTAKGASGVTTLTCVLGAVWPVERQVVVAECDPSGGDVAARFGLSTRVGMTSLILTQRQRLAPMSDYRVHTQQLPGGLDVLVAPPGPDAALSLDRELGSSSLDLVIPDCDLLADCGRLVPGASGQRKMLETADEVLLLVRPDVAGVARAMWGANYIRDSSSSARAVIVGVGDFKPGEVAQELGLSLLGVLPFDPRAAQMACGSPGPAKHFMRSGLVAFGREAVTALIGVAPVPVETDREGHGRSTKSRDLDRNDLSLERSNPISRIPMPDRQRRAHRTRSVSR